MTRFGRLKGLGDADPAGEQEDVLAAATRGELAPLLAPAAPAALVAAPVATPVAAMADVILVDLAEAIVVHGSSAAKGSGGGGGKGGAGGGSGGGTTTATTSYTSKGAYNVQILFQGTWTAAQQAVFIAAADRISTIIVGDVPDVGFRTSKIDDIQITAELKAIDGVGGILGQAGPTALRSVSYLPLAAAMQFDVADADSYLSQGLFDEIVTHEMLHSIGFGSIWSYKGLTSGSTFIGANAQAAYDTLVDAFNGFDNGVAALPVPLETGGGAGTAGSHWSEALFRNEMMTGYLNTSPLGAMVADPLSALTIASLKDLGYAVSSTPADPYWLV